MYGIELVGEVRQTTPVQSVRLMILSAMMVEYEWFMFLLLFLSFTTLMHWIHVC